MGLELDPATGEVRPGADGITLSDDASVGGGVIGRVLVVEALHATAKDAEMDTTTITVTVCAQGRDGEDCGLDVCAQGSDNECSGHGDCTQSIY